MVTKLNELIIETSSLEEMKDKYLAKRLVRSWKEDFVDEDNGEVVSIERNEMIYEKGTLLTSHELTEINFLLQSKDIETVHVSSQKRGACYINLISPEMIEDDSDEDDFYKMVVGVFYEHEDMIEQTYIIRGTDAEKAKGSIHKYIATNAEGERKGESFDLTIISASTIKCNDVVDYRFSQEYLEHTQE